MKRTILIENAYLTNEEIVEYGDEIIQSRIFCFLKEMNFDLYIEDITVIPKKETEEG